MSPSDPLGLWLLCVGFALLVSILTFGGIGGFIHYWFYVRKRHCAGEWKLQPNRWLSGELTRHAFALGTFNVLLAGAVAGTVAWYIVRGGWSMLYFDVNQHSLAYLPVSAVLIFFFIDGGLYYSHRLLHQRLLFRLIHRWHHRYVAPILFTTTAVHPVEMLIFETFLILPLFILPVHPAVYLGVIVYTYFIGMIDHSGVRIRWKLPFHEDNQFHDDHHVYFHCNYSHHTTLFDRLHGTVRVVDRYYDEHTFGGRGAPRARRT